MKKDAADTKAQQTNKNAEIILRNSKINFKPPDLQGSIEDNYKEL